MIQLSILILTTILLVQQQVVLGQKAFKAKIAYPNRTVLATNISGIITKLQLVDTTFDNVIDLIATGPTTFLSFRRNISTTTSKNGTKVQSVQFQKPISYSGISGIEAIGFVLQDKIPNTTSTTTVKATNTTNATAPVGWIVVANARTNNASTTTTTNSGNNGTVIKTNTSVTVTLNTITPTSAVQLVREVSTNVTKLGYKFTNLIPSTKFLNLTVVNGRSVKVYDMNLDGYQDIVVTIDGYVNGSTTPVGWLLLYKNRNGTGNFDRTIISTNLKGRTVIDIGDCDQNGMPDIVVVGLDSQKLDVFYQEINTVNYTQKTIDTAVPNGTASVAIGNYNTASKYKSDIILSGPSGQVGYVATIISYKPNWQLNPSVYYKFRLFTKNIMFDSLDPVPTSKDYHDYTAQFMDCDGDNYTDFITLEGKTNNIKCYRTLPPNGVDWYYPVVSVSVPKVMDIRDVNNDGILDIAVYSESDKAIYLYLGTKVA